MHLLHSTRCVNDLVDYGVRRCVMNQEQFIQSLDYSLPWHSIGIAYSVNDCFLADFLIMSRCLVCLTPVALWAHPQTLYTLWAHSQTLHTPDTLWARSQTVPTPGACGPIPRPYTLCGPIPRPYILQILCGPVPKPYLLRVPVGPFPDPMLYTLY